MKLFVRNYCKFMQELKIVSAGLRLYQKYTHVEKLKLQKDLTDAMEKHQKQLTEQVEKHQSELADALANQEVERAHRERLEEQLASQHLQLAELEQVEKELRDTAQPQNYRHAEVSSMKFDLQIYNMSVVLE